MALYQVTKIRPNTSGLNPYVMTAGLRFPTKVTDPEDLGAIVSWSSLSMMTALAVIHDPVLKYEA